MDCLCVNESIRRLNLLQRNSSLPPALKEKVHKLQQELKFLQTYVMFVDSLKGKHYRLSSTFTPASIGRVPDFYVPPSKPKHSGSTSDVSSIEDAFLKANSDLHNSLNEISLQRQSTLSADLPVTSMLQVIKDFELQIREAYTVFLKKQSWKSESTLDPEFSADFTESVCQNFHDLLHSKLFIGSLRKSVEFLHKKMLFLQDLAFWTSWQKITSQRRGALLGYTQAAAALAYLGWVHEADKTMASAIEIELSRLLQNIRPCTPELMEMYFELLQQAIRFDDGIALLAVSFVSFLIDDTESSMNDQFAAIREGLAFLITFVMDLPDDCTADRRQISADIQELTREAVSFNPPFLVNEVTESQPKEMNLLLSRLLEKTKLIKAEVCLMELLHSNNTIKVGVEDKFAALRDGLKFLRTLFDKLEDNTEDSKTFFSHVKEVGRKVTTVIFSIHANKRTEKMALILCLEKIKLIESEGYLLELQICHAHWMVAMKDQIEMLRQGLAFLRTFLMDNTDIEDKTEEGKLFLTYLQAVTTESSTLISSFLVNAFAEEMSNEFSLQLSKLVKKIKFLKAEVVLTVSLNHEVSTIVHMKDQIQTLQEGLVFLKSFLMDRPREHKANGEMIFKKCETVVNEAASLICSFYDDEMKEDKAMQIKFLLSELLEKIVDLKAEIRQMYLHVSKPLQPEHPRTDGLGFISSLLGNLKELLDGKVGSIALRKHQIELLHGEMDFLKSFLVGIEDQIDEHEERKKLWTRIMDIMYQAENVIDAFAIKDGPLWFRLLWLTIVIEEIHVIKTKVVETYDKNKFDTGARSIPQPSNHKPSRTSSSMIEEVVVGFSDEADKIIGRLTRGSAQMDIVSIVGMPGLGKTTLAKKVYNDPSVIYHFHIRAWCSISQGYQRRELLLDILGDIVELTDRIHKMADEDMAEELYRCLKGRRYLIVMDDLWDIGALEDLRQSFPNDSNGSRILFTSQLHHVALQAKQDCDPHYLRLFSDDESWELLQEKVFRKVGCPEALAEVGKEIAKCCKGLPLAVVVISGLLARTEKELDWWKQVSLSLSSHIVEDPQRECMRVLELSYMHLPEHLKSCFLYFGAFPNHREIPVSKLLWLWVAEGFFHKSNSKSSEDSAEECLLDLIARSLVVVAKRGADGRVKECRIHDLLQLLCMEKVKEENFLELVKGYDELLTTTADSFDSSVCSSYSYPSNSLTYEQRRLCICAKRKHFIMLKPRGPCARCLLFFASNDTDPRKSYDLSFICHNFKLIRVLDLESINMGNSFPVGLELLVLLRYLALRGEVESIPSSIANLWNLETFLVKGLRGQVELPESFWNMGRLRHVHINDRVAFSTKFNELENSSSLNDVVTLSTPVLYCDESTEKMMRRFTRLRKLRCIFSGERDALKNCYRFPELDFLTQLESLKVFYYGKICYPGDLKLPLTIKKLTLSKFCLPWSEISTIGRLPNLEVLKLLFKSFEGKRWDMNDGEFPKLKFLKLDSLDIGQWNASTDHFPCLQRLVLQRCKKLEQVPSRLGDIPTLETIEVHWCSHSAASSVRTIQEEQEDMGNEALNVLIYPPELGNRLSFLGRLQKIVGSYFN